MWYDGSLYVAAPSIWKLTDTTATAWPTSESSGSQARRSPAAPTTCTGRTWAWTAGSTGARGRSPSRRTSGRASRLCHRAAHIFRCRPDGTGIEPVMTGGMDNPVDVVFTPGGERIFTTTFSRESRRRPARRPDPRDLRRHLRQGSRPIFDPSHNGPARSHAGPAAHGTGRPVRTDPLRVRRLRQRVSGQPVRVLFQPAQGQPARV